MAQYTFSQRNELYAAIQTWTKRSNIPSGNKAEFVDMATERIGYDLKSNANEAFIKLSPDPQVNETTFYTLPDDFIEMRDVSYNRGNRIVGVPPFSGLESTQYPNLGSEPVGYLLFSQIENIEVTPNPHTGKMWFQVIPGNQADPVLVAYWHRPGALTSDSSWNVVLRTYGQLYLYSCLFDAFGYYQDWEASDRWKARYDDEIRRLNQRSSRSMYGPAMVKAHRIPHYSGASRAM